MLLLKQVRAEGFRGIRSGPILDFGHGGLLLLGNNGVGKTSWVDAIEKPLTGRCSSVETGDQSLSWAKHGGHIRSTEPPAVVLTISDGGADHEISFETDVATLPSNVRALLSAAKQSSFILRRRTLLDFINAKPQDRYKALEGFLNLDSYGLFERGLRGLQQWLAEELASLESTTERLETSIRAKLVLPVTTPVAEAKVVEKITQLLHEARLDPVSDLVHLSERKNEAEELMSAFGDVAALGRVNALGQRCEKLPLAESLVQAAQSCLEAAQNSFNEEQLLTGMFFAEVLTKGLEWMVDEKLANCPLCDSPIDLAAVKKSVEIKLASHQQLTQLRSVAVEQRRTFAAELSHYLGAFEQVVQDWPRAIKTPLPHEASEYISTLKLIESGLRSSASPTQLAENVKKLSTLANDELGGMIRGIIDDHKESFPDQDRYAALFVARDAIAASQDLFPKLMAARAKREQLEIHNAQIIRVVGHAETARKAAVQSLVDQVTSTADKYFQQIHPGEKIGAPSLEVTQRGTGSLSLTGEFYGRRGDPRGHYSEGHLDSLGLCLFLAMRRLHHDRHPELNLLVLDDVLHSVDGEHRRRTAKLIVAEFSDHQIIITTHDPLWFEYLKVATRGRSFLQRRVLSWTIDDGPRISDYVADYEWLISTEGQGAAAATRIITAGRLLEESLQNLCNNLEVPVPYRLRGDYSIDPLWINFVKVAKTNAEFYAVAQGPIQKIDELRLLRNLVGAHWNEWAQQLTPSEADEFCEVVLELRGLVYCDNCGEFIQRIGQLDGVWSCKKEHHRYERKTRIGSEAAKAPATPMRQEAPAKRSDTGPPKSIM